MLLWSDGQSFFRDDEHQLARAEKKLRACISVVSACCANSIGLTNQRHSDSHIDTTVGEQILVLDMSNYWAFVLIPPFDFFLLLFLLAISASLALLLGSRLYSDCLHDVFMGVFNFRGIGFLVKLTLRYTIVFWCFRH